MPLPDPGLRADDLGQEGFRSLVAMQNVVLGALLVIDDELQGDASAIRPIGMRRLAPIADHVARIGSFVRHHSPMKDRRTVRKRAGEKLPTRWQCGKKAVEATSCQARRMDVCLALCAINGVAQVATPVLEQGIRRP